MTLNYDTGENDDPVVAMTVRKLVAFDVFLEMLKHLRCDTKNSIEICFDGKLPQNNRGKVKFLAISPRQKSWWNVLMNEGATKKVIRMDWHPWGKDIEADEKEWIKTANTGRQTIRPA